MRSCQSVVAFGTDYAAEKCGTCVAGTISKDSKASSCTTCPVNTFAKPGSSTCTPCDTETEFAFEKSAACTKFPQCTANEYYEKYSACQASTGKETVSYAPLTIIDNTTPVCKGGVEAPASKDATCFCEDGTKNFDYV